MLNISKFRHRSFSYNLSFYSVKGQPHVLQVSTFFLKIFSQISVVVDDQKSLTKLIDSPRLCCKGFGFLTFRWLCHLGSEAPA